MDILSLGFLLGALLISDEILNGKLQVSRRLLEWMDRFGEASDRREKDPTR
ncbi:MAG: hypothetical protein ACP5D7_12195 [Limnospira sp.]